MKPADPVPETTWFAAEDGAAASGAARSLAAKLAAVEGLKAFPAVAHKILSILGRPDFRVADVTRALEEDPSLAAGVLRMANSAFFAGAHPVGSIDQAFVRLGSRTVREVVCAVATMGMFRDADGIAGEIRNHCASTAALVQLLARRFAPGSADGIFLAGLMHDVGKLLLIESQEIAYSKGDAREALAPDRTHLEERAALGYDHAVLGGHVMTAWRLPDPIPRAVARHHRGESALGDPGIGPMVALLRVADRIDFHLRVGDEPRDARLDELTAGPECALLGIIPAALAAMWRSDLVPTREGSLALFSAAR